MALKVEASAPSNIALIKYMGKTEAAVNRPANASLSYSLEHLRTFVTIEEAPATTWEPLPGYPKIELSEKGRTKFLKHFERLQKQWEIGGTYKIKSANNFPSDCGLASSASSFAALTLATYELACAKRPGFAVEKPELSRLSRMGSGSSCRSLYWPWAIWREEAAEPVDLPLRLHHAVIMVEDGIKAVSSSDAHVRVTSSLLYKGRPARADERLGALTAALETAATRAPSDRWREAFELCWAEFWDMHALFETSQPSFGYMNEGSLKALSHLRRIWESGDGPLVTMDAGPNIHVLLREDQVAKADGWLQGMQTYKSWGVK